MQGYANGILDGVAVKDVLFKLKKRYDTDNKTQRVLLTEDMVKGFTRTPPRLVLGGVFVDLVVLCA